VTSTAKTAEQVPVVQRGSQPNVPQQDQSLSVKNNSGNLDTKLDTKSNKFSQRFVSNSNNQDHGSTNNNNNLVQRLVGNSGNVETIHIDGVGNHKTTRISNVGNTEMEHLDEANNNRQSTGRGPQQQPQAPRLGEQEVEAEWSSPVQPRLPYGQPFVQINMNSAAPERFLPSQPLLYPQQQQVAAPLPLVNSLGVPSATTTLLQQQPTFAPPVLVSSPPQVLGTPVVQAPPVAPLSLPAHLDARLMQQPYLMAPPLGQLPFGQQPFGVAPQQNGLMMLPYGQNGQPILYPPIMPMHPALQGGWPMMDFNFKYPQAPIVAPIFLPRPLEKPRDWSSESEADLKRLRKSHARLIKRLDKKLEADKPHPPINVHIHKQEEPKKVEEPKKEEPKKEEPKKEQPVEEKKEPEKVVIIEKAPKDLPKLTEQIVVPKTVVEEPKEEEESSYWPSLSFLSRKPREKPAPKQEEVIEWETIRVPKRKVIQKEEK